MTAATEMRMIEKTVPKAITAKINEDEIGGGRRIMEPLVDEVVCEVLSVYLCEVEVVTLVVSVLVALTTLCI
jgi:hypothetical protein